MLCECISNRFREIRARVEGKTSLLSTNKKVDRNRSQRSANKGKDLNNLNIRAEAKKPRFRDLKECFFIYFHLSPDARQVCDHTKAPRNSARSCFGPLKHFRLTVYRNSHRQGASGTSLYHKGKHKRIEL